MFHLILSPAVTINGEVISCQRIIKIDIKGTIMQTEKTLINDALRVSKHRV